jgi:hypothetical protein
MVDRNELIAIIAKAIRDVRINCPAIEPGVAHESVPFAEAVLDALDRAGLKVVPNEESSVNQQCPSRFDDREYIRSQ